MPDFARGHVFQDKKNRKTVVIVKKSGASYLFGPIDPELLNKVKLRVPDAGRGEPIPAPTTLS